MNKLPQNRFHQCEEAFNLFDRKREGKISVEEIGDVMRTLGVNPSQAELEKKLEEADLKKNGKIDLNEFVELFGDEVAEPDNEEDFIEAFNVFDPDGTGKVNAKELRTMLLSLGEKLSEEETDSILKQVNQDSDGNIDYQEFVKIMLR